MVLLLSDEPAACEANGALRGRGASGGKVDCSGGSSELLKEKLYERPPREKGNFHIIIRSSNYSNKRV